MTNTGGRTRRDRDKHWTEEEARRELVACARSGLSVRAFSQREGLRPKRLYWWMRRHGLATIHDAVAQPPEPRRRRRASRRAPRFVPVVVKTRSTSAPATAAIVIRRGGSTTMEIDATASVSAAWVAAVMIELERAGCS
jgi:hypothetical protein